MILHIVNRSPFNSTTLQRCLQFAAPDSGLLLITDGVIAATTGSPFSDLLMAALKKHSVYALTPDLQARGLIESMIEGVRAIDYSEFVMLVTQYDKTQTWS